ncbi:hypothetical protein [Enterococcus sp. DIV1420a]|uniref:hypothetical protein n=1 Tax=Enterococcus TaxID=1350 RepID=UPI0036D6420B
MAIGTNIKCKNYYVLLTVEFHNKELKHNYSRIIVYRNTISREKALNILAISLNDITIISVKEEYALCLVNDLKEPAYFNGIEKYWIDGTVIVMSIVENNGDYSYTYVVTEVNDHGIIDSTCFRAFLNSKREFYWEELQDCWVLRGRYYDWSNEKLVIDNKD